ncbi:MAG: tRNA lysidine(34) synthetase TilS [Candidatus Gracilibacteria bacterium]|nr:tRNA lysidine(34) synthetase TilS [Candidatus Gracilibacteria bacterium]
MDFNDFFKKYSIKEKDKLIIACSGGSDSMFLLSEIIKFHPKESTIVVHFNHQLRDIESNSDQIFVENFCKKNNLTLVVGTSNIGELSVKNKTGIEETARIERYKFLNKIKDKYEASYILTAHHLDDNIETFMFNLIRGTRLNGLTGIEELSEDILRPLLHLTKNNILEKCTQEEIEFIYDSSNSDDNYLRNHIRLNIIPEFDKINPSYPKAFDSIISYFGELKSFLDENIIKYIKTVENSTISVISSGNEKSLLIKSIDNKTGRKEETANENFKIFKNYIEILEFQTLSAFLQKELISHIFKIRNAGTIGLTQGNIDEIIRFISDKGNYTKKEIKKLFLFKKNGKIFF